MEGNHELVPQITISHSDSKKRVLGFFSSIVLWYLSSFFFIDNYGSLPPSLSVLAALSVMHGNFIYKMQYPFAERTTMLPGGLNVISVFCVYTTL